MSNKKNIKKEVELKINWESKNKKLGYDGYNITELKNYWKTMAKSARLYGDTRTANKLDKWVSLASKEVKEGRGDKLRRKINITSNMSQIAPIRYGKNEKGNYVSLIAIKPPRESKKLKDFREQSKDILKEFKSLSIKSPTMYLVYANALSELGKDVSDSDKESAAIILNMVKSSGSFNNAFSKYSQDVDRLLKGGEISLLEMSLIAKFAGVETKAGDEVNKLRYRKK